jgi:hypothetical protein
MTLLFFALSFTTGTGPLLADSPNAQDFMNELKGMYLNNPAPAPEMSPENTPQSPPKRNVPPLAPPVRSQPAPEARRPRVDQSMLATTFAIPRGKSRLVVETSNVRFATVLVDGTIMGLTPIAIDLPGSRGKVTVKIWKKGYRPKTENIHLQAGRTEKWIARLRPLSVTDP